MLHSTVTVESDARFDEWMSQGVSEGWRWGGMGTRRGFYWSGSTFLYYSNHPLTCWSFYLVLIEGLLCVKLDKWAFVVFSLIRETSYNHEARRTSGIMQDMLMWFSNSPENCRPVETGCVVFSRGCGESGAPWGRGRWAFGVQGSDGPLVEKEKYLIQAWVSLWLVSLLNRFFMGKSHVLSNHFLLMDLQQ